MIAGTTLKPKGRMEETKLGTDSSWTGLTANVTRLLVEEVVAMVVVVVVE